MADPLKGTIACYNTHITSIASDENSIVVSSGLALTGVNYTGIASKLRTGDLLEICYQSVNVAGHADGEVASGAS